MDLANASRLAVRELRRSVTDQLALKTPLDFSVPSAIRAIVTERCNYKCHYCTFWRQDSYSEEMSLDEWKAALLSLRKFVGRFLIQFVGGEPFVRRDLIDILEYCYSQRIDWGVITNGSALTRSMCERLVRAHPTNIDISIDSLDAATHDAARGVRGSLVKISRAVEMLLEARARHGRNFIVRIKTTVDRRNAGHMVDLARGAGSLGGVVIDFSPVRLWKEGEIEASYPRSEADFAVLDEALGELLAMKQAGAPIETTEEKLRAMPAHFRGEEKVFHAFKICRVALRDFHINPNGDVTHCWFYEPIGNLRTSTAAQIWRGEERAEMKPKMFACDKAGSGVCSTACTAHRTFKQNVSKGLLLLKQAAGRHA